MILLRLTTILLLLSGCTNRDTTVDKKKLYGFDYRLFQNTPAWELAKSVEDSDVNKIKEILDKDKKLVDYTEPIYGQTLLNIAVQRKNYRSVVTLLAEGANPNKQEIDGTSALMQAASVGGKTVDNLGADSRYLKALLKYGGDPNAVQQPNRSSKNTTHFTPLIFACRVGVLDYVKILVEAGANVNSGSDQKFTALFQSVVSDSPDLVMYLLQKGANYKEPLLINAKGEKKYLADVMEFWHFEKGSEQYRLQQEIVAFLNKNK